MTNYQMTIKELENMLATPEFESEIYPTHSHPTFERLNDYGNIKTLFDDLTEELGRIPSQSEYIESGFKRAEKFFSPRPGKKPDVTRYWGKNDTYSATFNWNDPELQKAVKKRLSRTYPSFLTEYSTIIQLKALYPDYYIGTNDWLDTTAGIDIVVGSPQHNRIAYIHVTSNSKQSDSTLNEKKTRWGIAFDSTGKKHWYERNFNKGHIHLAFDKFTETDSTKFVNGNPIMKPEHLQLVIDTTMSVPDPNNRMFDTWCASTADKDNHQLLHLHYFLLSNKVDANGLGQVWV